MLTKPEASLGRGTWTESRRVREPSSATRLSVSRVMVRGFISRLSLASHSGSGSFLVAHASLSQDGCQQRGFWEVGRSHGLVFPFDLSQTLLVGGGLPAPCSLPDLLS